MSLRVHPLLTALAGFAAGALCFSLATSLPASAQLQQLPIGGSTIVTTGNGSQLAPQPIEVQALDSNHFVVATREPRLVTIPGREGSAQNLMATVVTHYTVSGDGRLVPTEHVRVPAPYRVVQLEER